MDTITTQISLADSAAESMSNQLVRARELAIIAANGTMTATDRQNISTELAQIIEQVLALANTRDSSGQYRTEERRVGEEGVSQCNSRWSTYPQKKQKKK